MARQRRPRPSARRVKHIRHPVLGPIAFEYSAFAVDGRTDLSMVVYNPATRTDAADQRDDQFAVRTRTGLIVARGTMDARINQTIGVSRREHADRDTRLDPSRDGYRHAPPICRLGQVPTRKHSEREFRIRFRNAQARGRFSLDKSGREPYENQNHQRYRDPVGRHRDTGAGARPYRDREAGMAWSRSRAEPTTGPIVSGAHR